MLKLVAVTVWRRQFNVPAINGGQVGLGEKVGPAMLPLNEIVPEPTTTPESVAEIGVSESQLRPEGGLSVTLTLMSGVSVKLVPS